MLVWILIAIVIVLVGGIRYVTAMPGRSYRGDLPPLSDHTATLSARLRSHVATLAAEIGERHLHRPKALERAARYVEDSLEGLGYAVERHPYAVGGHEVRNLVAERPGASSTDVVVIGAHYDTVPGCPGANDNGTGVAALLELARCWVSRRPVHTLRFVAFVNEEPPYCFTNSMGSRVYARQCRRRGDRVLGMLSLETIGCYSNRAGSQAYPLPFGLLYPRTGNFIGFVANLSSRRLVRRCVRAFRECVAFPSEGTAAPGYLPGIFWSDHWSFWREGYPAVMVTDTAPFRYRHYHTPGDTLDKIDFASMARVVSGLDGVAIALAGLVGGEVRTGE